MTTAESYEIHKDDLIKLSFINSFLALRDAFQAGWDAREKEMDRQKELT